MKIYNFDRNTKEFISEELAQKSPLEKEAYLIPADATTIKPKATKNGFTQCFNEFSQKWEFIEDNRKKIVYEKDTKKELKIDYLGEIKDEHTLLIPNQFDKWDEDTKEWVEDEVLKKEFEDIEKLKEINSLKEYLRDTDFYYVRKDETGDLVPTDVLEKRLATRLRIRELEDNEDWGE